VYDLIDGDILHRVEELKREEGLRQAEAEDDDFEIDGAELTPEQQEALTEIRRKKRLLIQQHRIKKSTAESRPTECAADLHLGKVGKGRDDGMDIDDD
jgi:nucleolar GTP-binding protein